MHRLFCHSKRNLFAVAGAGSAVFLNSAFTQTEGSRAYTWGNGLGGRLGHSSEKSIAEPILVDQLPSVVDLLCSKESSYALTESGELYSWGNGAGGKLGHGNDFNQASPALIQELANKDVVVQVSSGDNHTAVLCKSGRVYTWGSGRSFALGHGKRGDVAVPQVVEALEGMEIASVECGAIHTVVLTKAGQVYSFGNGFEGALGHGTKDNQKLPLQIILPEGVKITQASCGRNFTLLLDEQGGLYAFGDDAYGQLGLGRSERYVRTPQKVQYLARNQITRIEAGENHAGAITSTGECYIWGYNSSGQLGNGNTGDLLVPTKLEFSDQVKAISCGGHHTFVQLQGGDVYVFGRGREGQLGIQASGVSVAAYRHTPVALPMPGKIVKLSAGGDHSGALVK